MKKPDIARRLARRSGVTTAEAADRLDRIVSQILDNVRKGKDASLPGLGRFTRTPDGALVFEAEKDLGRA
jgi:nucleoid DNA-binding protein